MNTFLYYAGCALLGASLSVNGYPVTEKPIEFFVMFFLGSIILHALLLKRNDK